MIGLLRHGDDGLTDRQRRLRAERYARTLGAAPSAETFDRLRASTIAPVPVGVRPPAPGARCLVCGHDAATGDDLCTDHGGMNDGIARHAAMRAAGLT